ncbi:MAG: IS4 family transposase [Gammaproteobacteria bacterium]
MQRLLGAKPAPSRTQLTRQLCRRLDLRDPKGDWQIGTTAKALRELEALGHWTLPPPRVPHTRPWSNAPTRLPQRVPPARGVPKELAEFATLELLEVATPEHLLVWNELMIREHPLHDARLVGRQHRYLIRSEHGWLGGIGFGSAALYLESRDTWLGWTAAQRTAQLPRVLNMTRFLLRPGVRCPNLASHVLGLCARRIAADFERRYGLQPWLMESFVDPSADEGTCYKAANWTHVGRTKGRGRNGARDAGKTRKDVYLYPLVKDIRAQLGVDRFPWEPLAASHGLEGERWAEQEFGACELGDRRLTRRLVKIVTDEAVQPGASHTEAARGDAHQAKACYRFLKNDAPEMNVANLLQTHRTQTLRRCKAQSTVLIVQDTTELNFTSRPQCEGLGTTKANQTGAVTRSLNLHSSLALEAESGLPLGVLRLHGYAPEPAAGKDPQRPIEEKESHRWIAAYHDANDIAALLPGTRVISIADREGDFFELFDARRRQPGGDRAHLLVRAKHDRKLEGTDAKLFAELAQAPLAGTVKIAVPRQREHPGKPSAPGQPGLPAREAKVELRYQEVALPAPDTPALRGRPSLRLWAIHLQEKNPPPGAAAVHWVLLTTMPVTSRKQALRSLRWYCRRWRIEEWHRVLKSGCKILEHQHHDAETLLRAIALDAVIAWRIMLLALLGREVPGLPAEQLFDACECEVLELLASKKNSPWVKP